MHVKIHKYTNLLSILTIFDFSIDILIFVARIQHRCFIIQILFQMNKSADLETGQFGPLWQNIERALSIKTPTWRPIGCLNTELNIELFRQ